MPLDHDVVPPERVEAGPGQRQQATSAFTIPGEAPPLDDPLAHALADGISELGAEMRGLVSTAVEDAVGARLNELGPAPTGVARSHVEGALAGMAMFAVSLLACVALTRTYRR